MNEKKNITTEKSFALAIQNHQKNNFQVAENFYRKTLKTNSKHVAGHNNLGVLLLQSGKYQKAKSCFEKAIEIKPGYAEAHNNLGLLFKELGELQKAKSCHQKAIQIQPNYLGAYWNLHAFASDTDEALTILKKLYQIDNTFIKAKIMISALHGFKGNFSEFESLNKSSESIHPHMRSIKWIFSLPKLPKIFFNRWYFFDGVVALADKSRPQNIFSSKFFSYVNNIMIKLI